MIVLDTHAWIGWVNESEQLSKKAAEAIHSASTLGICAISCWEIAMLVVKNRLRLNQEVMGWIDLALKRPKTRLLTLEPKIRVTSTQLPGDFHGDPADRFIAASYLIHKATLITKDKQISDWPHLKAIW
jgi:PIN domain nuclease of toxin-antitoxin system